MTIATCPTCSGSGLVQGVGLDSAGRVLVAMSTYRRCWCNARTVLDPKTEHEFTGLHWLGEHSDGPDSLYECVSAFLEGREDLTEAQIDTLRWHFSQWVQGVLGIARSYMTHTEYEGLIESLSGWEIILAGADDAPKLREAYRWLCKRYVDPI